jgi:phosphate transport system permease protein
MTILQEKPSEETFKEPQYPWKKANPSTSLTNSIIVVLPISVFALSFFLTDFPGALLFIIVFLPVQILVAIFATLWGISKKRVGDAVLSVLSLVAFSFVIALMGSVLFSVFSRGLPAISLSFLTQNNTYISPTTELDYGGVGHALLGTLMVVAIGMIISIPLGIASAIYITDMKGRLAGFVRFMVQAMSGVPSIVAGLFILAAFILTDVSGFSALTGGLAYSILMLPTVARTSEEVLKLVPKD